MGLTEIEAKVIQSCCDLNDNLMIVVRENDREFSYNSRFLNVNFEKKYIIIDVPTPDKVTPDAKPLSRGQYFEVFFQYKIFRYLFPSKVLEHTNFKLNERTFHSLKILLPRALKDGDKREYFRVETGMRPPLSVYFNIFPKGAEMPLMSAIVKGSRAEFEAQMVDISGGGFAMRSKPGDKSFLLDKGDIILARFKLKEGIDEVELWAETCNARHYKETNIAVWGFRWFGKERNRNINFHRNKILRFVMDRQREIMSK